MEKFLEYGAKAGVDKVADRASRLEASITAQCSDAILFLICGLDYIFNPVDSKFQGIVNLFILEDGAFVVNIYPECRQAVLSLLRNPDIKVTLEGYGVPRLYDPNQAKKRAGVRAGGAGNYNLQTKALELVVTHDHGLNFQHTLETGIADFNKNYGKGAALSALMTSIRKDTQNQMRRELTPYWGGDIRNVGL